MGSFAAHVDLPEHLRAWAAAGLGTLFLPGGLPSVATPVLAEPQAQTAQPLAETPGLAAQALPQEAALPPWPAPWSTLAARVRTRPRVIITYSALADDVSGTADPARRKLFQTILGYLAWPAGSTLFWPISFPTGVDPGPHFASDLFAAGVAHFGIRHLLCFGQAVGDRATTLFPQEGKSSPVTVHRAPGPEALLPMLPHELHQALAHLKGLLAT